MDKLKNIVLVMIIGAILAIAGSLTNLASNLIPSKPVQVIVQEQSAKILGALAGPDIPYPYLSFGDVRKWASSRTLNQASTTICSLVSPFSTSTLMSGSVQITTGTTTVIALEIGKSTLMDATTTRLSYMVLGSGKQVTLGAFVASTTGTFGALAQQNTADPNDMVFAPSSRLNVKIGGTLDAKNTLVGTCNATWEQN